MGITIVAELESVSSIFKTRGISPFRMVNPYSLQSSYDGLISQFKVGYLGLRDFQQIRSICLSGKERLAVLEEEILISYLCPQLH